MSRLFLTLLYFLLFFDIEAQDSLSIEHLQDLTFSFQIVDGQISGDGADFLSDEIARAQYTLLGDYLDSKRIPELTAALLPLLNHAGYKTLALGTGPVVTDVLQCQHSTKILKAVESLNAEHSFNVGTRRVFPIPDLKYKEDALFLQKAMHQDWKLIGFGYDSWNGLGILLDEMYRRLPFTLKKENEEKYRQAKSELSKVYLSQDYNLLLFRETIKTNQAISLFVEAAAEVADNKDVVSSYQKALDQSFMHANKMYFEKNKTRVLDEKKLLKKGMESLKHNISSDKIFVKWDFNFLSRGLQPYAFYGVGNMLSEIAQFNDNSSLNIGVMKRYYEQEGQVKDVLKEHAGLRKQFGRLLQMGHKDHWVVIDLRSFVKDYNYWPQKFLLNEAIFDLAKRYDLIVIPPVEGTPELIE